MATQIYSKSEPYKIEVARFGVTADKYSAIAMPVAGDWRVTDLKLTISIQQQTYSAGILAQVNAIFDWGIGVLVDQGFGVPPTVNWDYKQSRTLTWDGLNYPSGFVDTMSVPDYLQAATNRQIIVHVTYDLPFNSTLMDSLSYTVQIDATEYSPTGTTPAPQLGTFTNFNSGGFDWSGIVTLGAFAVVGVIGLVALGYASEKTGVNAGSLGGVTKGVSNAIKSIKLPKLAIPKISL